MLGYNYPGDPWYADAYKLMTSRGVRPAVEPDAKGKHGRHFLPFHHDRKDQQPLSAPPVASAEPSDAATASAPAATTAATAPAKKKKGWFNWL